MQPFGHQTLKPCEHDRLQSFLVLCPAHMHCILFFVFVPDPVAVFYARVHGHECRQTILVYFKKQAAVDAVKREIRVGILSRKRGVPKARVLLDLL